MRQGPTPAARPRKGLHRVENHLGTVEPATGVGVAVIRTRKEPLGILAPRGQEEHVVATRFERMYQVGGGTGDASSIGVARAEHGQAH